ncbi:MAG: PilZ domain-containing protein, partial [Deltaproteobacteria bacterium]|nr:PilZ domain-containing protein [Deltaproteobacteria bacterium]
MDDDAQSDPSHRRRAPRASVVLQLQYRSTSHLLVSYCTNLSRGGLFVPTQEPLSPGSRLTVSLQVPGAMEPIEAEAEVRWVRAFDAS